MGNGEQNAGQGQGQELTGGGDIKPPAGVNEEKPQIPAWARGQWETYKKKVIAATGYEPHEPVMRAATQFIVPTGQVTTITDYHSIVEMMAVKGDHEFLEVESPDFKGQTFQIRKKDIVAFLPVRIEAMFPDERPMIQGQPLPSILGG